MMVQYGLLFFTREVAMTERVRYGESWEKWRDHILMTSPRNLLVSMELEGKG
jgi:hypothetical protein